MYPDHLVLTLLLLLWLAIVQWKDKVHLYELFGAAFHGLKLGMDVAVHRLLVVGRCLGAMQHEVPFKEDAGVLILIVVGVEGDLEGPSAAGLLSPGVGGHERPFGEPVLAVVIIGTRTQDH